MDAARANTRESARPGPDDGRRGSARRGAAAQGRAAAPSDARTVTGIARVVAKTRLDDEARVMVCAHPRDERE
jgi:hypothetical protein